MNFSILHVSDVIAQTNLDAADLSQVRSEQISDEQLEFYINRAKDENITPEQAMELARQRGLPSTTALDLMSRIRNMELSSQASPVSSSQKVISYHPEAPYDTVEIESVDPLIFGSSLFSHGTLAFEPSMNIPTPLNYQLGAGDELIIDIWGAATNFYQLEVSHEGTINIDNLGPIFVHGLTIKEAEARIMDKLKLLYRGLNPDDPNRNTFARISLGRVRTIQVTLMGEVRKPGNYTVSSLATVFNALHKAGGPNQIGSYRQIEIYRENRKITELDIYDFLLKGDQSNNIRLHDQDVIRVATYNKRVLLKGEIKRPGYYEIKEGETLNNAILFSGYFTKSAYTRQLKINRMTETEYMLVSVDRDQYIDFELNNGDEITVDPILNRFSNRVSISGAVWRPGEFELEEGMMLSQLLEKAEGLKPDAFRSRGIINRLSDSFDFTIISFDVDALIEQTHKHDIALQMEDEVIIKSIHEMREDLTVTIKGEVQKPANYKYREGMTLEDLILNANGFKASASEARIEINRRIIGDAAPQFRGPSMAETFIFSVSRDLRLNDAAGSFVLEHFDQVFVRKRPDYQTQKYVFIEGEVLFPGEYTLTNRQEKISDLVKRAGGITSEAYIEGATLLRLIHQLERTEVEIDPDENNIINIDNSSDRYIGINLDKILNKPGSKEDLYLRPGDIIRIPSELQTVSIRGAVLRESEVRFQEGTGLRKYVNRAGGFSDNARKRNAYVVYANGDVVAQKKFLFFNNCPKIMPGAEIIIPEKEPKPRMTSGERLSVLSAVVSMSAVVVTALSRVW